MCVTRHWQRGRSLAVCRVTGREILELGRDRRDCGLSEALDNGLAVDKLDKGLA